MDPTPPTSRPETCPECGAPFPNEAIYCWLCGWKLGNLVVGPRKGSPTTNPRAAALRNPADLKWTFSLSTLFLWTALVAVVMGVVRIAPGLGVPLAIIAIPAALHTTALVAFRKRRSGHALTVPEKLFAFIASFAIFMLAAIVITVSACFAAFVICLSSLNRSAPNNSTTINVIFGIIVVAVLIVAYIPLRSLWRTKD